MSGGPECGRQSGIHQGLKLGPLHQARAALQHLAAHRPYSRGPGHSISAKTGGPELRSHQLYRKHGELIRGEGGRRSKEGEPLLYTCTVVRGLRMAAV